ncbi:MAG: hypothetical protein RLZZ28_2182 [Bacteroidota bacterium]
MQLLLKQVLTCDHHFVQPFYPLLFMLKKHTQPGRKQHPFAIVLLSNFIPLSTDFKEFLLSKVKHHSFRKGDLLLKAGDKCGDMHFIKKGLFRGFMEEDGKEITTWMSCENELVTSISGYFGRQPSLESIQALESGITESFSFKDIQYSFDHFPEFNLPYRKLVEQYMISAENRAFLARIPNARKRYAYVKNSTANVLTAADAGNYTVVVTGGCSNITSDASVWTVNPLPVIPAITGAAPVCVGNTIQLANAIAGGVWASTNNAVATVSTSGLVTAVNAGTATINYTVTSTAGCVSFTGTTVTVNALPTVTAAASSTSVSKGLTVQLLSTVGAPVSSYSWTPAANLSGATIANPIARVVDNTIYTVVVTNALGCTATASTSVTAVEDLYVQPTNVFTPNGDGINDRFVIKNLDQYPVNKLQVFDRTGKVLYERNNYTNDWDGTVSGALLTKDTYFYVLSVKGQIVKRGTITLVR